jgi:hypothetical protein
VARIRFSWTILLSTLLALVAAACEEAQPEGSEDTAGCQANLVNCGAGCVDLATSPLHCGQCGIGCGAGQVCSAGVCSCTGVTTLCNGMCMDLASNALNCGTCGVACGVGQTCRGGVCTCAGTQIACNGTCVDPAVDAANCGGCGMACSTGSSCVGGACTCEAGRTSCANLCVDVMSDGNNCGACGNVCQAGMVCSGGVCAGGCAAGQTACGSSCVNTQMDPGHCGACNYSCPGGQACNLGSCGCTGGQTLCSGICTDLQTDSENCGGCQVACATGQTCVAGACGCAAGQSPCGGTCIDTSSDPSNCGGCGVICSGGSACVGGTCSCPVAGQTQCAGVCTDTLTDAGNCGVCGNACGGSATCQNGTCVGDNPGTGGGGPGTGGGGPGSGGSNGSSCPDVSFTVSSSLSDAISTVGIVDWSVNVSADSAYIDFGRTAGDWEFQAPVTSPSQSNRTLLLGMKPGTTYSYQVVIQRGGETCSSEVQELTTGAKRNGLPSVTLNTPNASAVYEGFTVLCQFAMTFGTGGGSWTFIFDQDGELVWWYQGSGGGDCVRAMMSYDGQYMWMANGNVPGPSSGTLTRVMMDGTNETSFSVPNRHHDITVMPDESVIYIDYDNGQANGCDTIRSLNPQTQAKSDVFSVQQANGGSNPNCHTNAINWWPDHNIFTASVLNWDTIIAFDQQGSLQWLIGGSASTYSGASWDNQHNHHYLGTSLVLFNNNGTNGGSSVLEYQLNGNQAQQTMNYASGLQTNSMGDAKRLPNGNTLVTYSNPGVIHEIDASAQLVQEITIGGTSGATGVGYTKRRRTLYGPPPPYQD